MRHLLDQLRDLRLPELRAEHRAVLGLVGLAVLGQGARVAVLPPAAPPGAFAVPGASANPLQHRDSARAMAQLRSGERVDADRATAADLARVPGIGAGLAKRMVAHRAAHGPFGGLAGIDRVPGVGPAKLSRIAPYLAFSGVTTGSATLVTKPGGAPGPMNFGTEPILSEWARRPSVLTTTTDRMLPPTGGRSAGPDVNTADSAALVQFPGIGPAKAGVVARWRAAHGPFKSPDDLARIPGIGPKTAAKVWAAGAPK